MPDTCVILTYTKVTDEDEFGLPEVTYLEGEVTECGFNPGSPAREVLGQAQVSVTAPQIRLPITATFLARDRLKLTHRHGEELINQPIYEIVGDPRRGPSGLVVNCRLVTDGSRDGDIV